MLYKAGIIGTGSYVPEKVLTNFDLEKIVDTSDEWIRTRTGIVERRIAADNETTSCLGYNAGKAALKDAGMSPKDLDLIIVATITPDMLTPSTSCLIQNKLAANNATAFDLSAACSGFLYGLTIAKSLIQSGVYKNILLIAAETLSRFVNWEDRNTCVLFGDGAGAVVISQVKDNQGQIVDSYLGANGQYAELLQIPAGGSKNPADKETVEKHLHCLHMKGNEVFKVAVQSMVEASAKVLEKAKMKAEDMACIIPHQANIRIINAIGKRLDVPQEKIYINVDKYGNTSAATIAIALDEVKRKKIVKKGDYVLFVSFGAGFTWGATIIRI